MKNKLYVLVRVSKTGEVTVHGNRHCEPFSNDVNAKRSMTKRATHRGADTTDKWSVEEILP